MNEEDSKFPKVYVAKGRIVQGEAVYGQRTVDAMQAEIAALRQELAREQELCRANADAGLWLAKRVDTLTAALETAEKYISGTGQRFSERETTPVLWQIRKALAAVADEKAAGENDT